MPCQSEEGMDPKAGKHNPTFRFILSRISDPIKLWEKPEARVTGFSHMTGVITKCQEDGGGVPLGRGMEMLPEVK